MINITNIILVNVTAAASANHEDAAIWTPEVIARVATLVVIMAATIVGNVSMIVGILCNASLSRRRVSIFLINLAVADLMVCVITMTSEILFVAFGQWVLGAIVCKLAVYGQIVTLASTTFLLTAMSIDSYQVLVEPLRSIRSGRPSISRKVVAAWALAFVFATPQLFIFVETTQEIENDAGGRRTVRACLSRGYTAEWQRKVYMTFLAGYILIIPTAIMTFCYLNIIRAVWTRVSDATGLNGDHPRVHFISSRRSRSVSQEDNRNAIEIGIEHHQPSMFGLQSSPRDQPAASTSSRHSVHQVVMTTRPDGYPSPSVVAYSTHRQSYQRQSRQRSETITVLPKRMVTSSKRHVVRMTLSVIVGFVVCWSPYFGVSLVRVYTDYRIRLTGLLSICELITLAHSALNPLLYGLFSLRALRRSFEGWCIRHRRRRRPSGESARCCCYGCRWCASCCPWWLRSESEQVVGDISPGDQRAVPDISRNVALAQRSSIEMRPVNDWRRTSAFGATTMTAVETGATSSPKNVDSFSYAGRRTSYDTFVRSAVRSDVNDGGKKRPLPLLDRQQSSQPSFPTSSNQLSRRRMSTSVALITSSQTVTSLHSVTDLAPRVDRRRSTNDGISTVTEG